MAIEKVNTVDEHGSKIVRNRVFDCNLSQVRRTNGNQKHCFQLFFIYVSQLFRVFCLATNIDGNGVILVIVPGS